MTKEEKIYELRQRIEFYEMQKTNLAHKDGWKPDDYTWNNELSKDVSKLEEWIKEIQEDGIFRSAVTHG